MKKLITLFAISGTILVFANCSSTKPAATSSNNNAAMEADATVADLKKKFSEAQMEEGRVVWETKCNKCHKLYKPTDRNVGQWEGILPRMVKRAKLDDTQAGNVRAYIITHSRTS
jgi:cytochrome c2